MAAALLCSLRDWLNVNFLEHPHPRLCAGHVTSLRLETTVELGLRWHDAAPQIKKLHAHLLHGRLTISTMNTVAFLLALCDLFILFMPIHTIADHHLFEFQ